jgi:hypothetical protein
MRTSITSLEAGALAQDSMSSSVILGSQTMPFHPSEPIDLQ